MSKVHILGIESSTPTYIGSLPITLHVKARCNGVDFQVELNEEVSKDILNLVEADVQEQFVAALGTLDA
jgi:hypothetical protein